MWGYLRGANNVTRPSGGGNRRTNGGPQLVCENCGFNKHTIDRCFKLISYPADIGKRNNNNNNSQGTQNFNRRFINNNSVGSSSSSTFSDDQLSKIISLIKDNSLNNGKGVQANMASTILNKSRLFHKNFKRFFSSNSQLHSALVAAGVIVDSGANQHLTYTDTDESQDQVLRILGHDLTFDNSDLDHCEICQKSKQTRELFPLSERKSSVLAELVHLDLWGPYRVTSKYTIFVDVATSMDDVGVSKIRSSGGCMPHVVITASHYHNRVQKRKSLWDHLKNLFHDNKDARAINLDNELRSIKIGKIMVNEYCTKIQAMANRLKNLDCEVSEKNYGDLRG
ncbi:hypothetical protein Tco_0468728 [Tanacetum coccineum]